jgi:hypothetical protein
MICVVLAFVIALCSVVRGGDEKPVIGEVEITRGELVSELSVFIVNNGSTDFRFPTGARGAGQSVPEDRIAGGGTGLKVVPHLTFERADSVRAPYQSIHFRAPIFTSPQNRGMEEQVFVVPAGKRRLYYSFKVPSEYVIGRFKHGVLPRPDIYEPLKARGGGYGPIESVGAITITRLIDVTDKKAALKDDEKR